MLKPYRNLGDTERLLSGIAGTALILGSLRERGTRGWFLAIFGYALYLRGFTGNSKLYQLLGHTRVGPPLTDEAYGIHVHRTFLINRPVADVYRAWRNFENLPHFMSHLERVTVLSPLRSRWVAKAPAGLHVTWDAEIVEEKPNALIAWRSLDNADVDNAGKIFFRDLNGVTEIEVMLHYSPPGGRPGAALARLFQEEPTRQIELDLLRFKHMMEVAG